jgi:hypothetical protein
MNLFKKASLSLLALMFILTSATIVPRHTTPKINDVTAVVNSAKADGKISKKELRTIAETAKGSSLTLKEKIALSIFGKKIGNKIVAEANAAGAEGGGKSQLIALLICFFIGGLGIHRFYLGYTWQGIVQLLTLGGCGVWSLIDFVRICMGTLKPKGGDYDKTL